MKVFAKIATLVITLAFVTVWLAGGAKSGKAEDDVPTPVMGEYVPEGIPSGTVAPPPSEEHPRMEDYAPETAKTRSVTIEKQVTVEEAEAVVTQNGEASQLPVEAPVGPAPATREDLVQTEERIIGAVKAQCRCPETCVKHPRVAKRYTRPARKPVTRRPVSRKPRYTRVASRSKRGYLTRDCSDLREQMAQTNRRVDVLEEKVDHHYKVHGEAIRSNRAISSAAFHRSRANTAELEEHDLRLTRLEAALGQTPPVPGTVTPAPGTAIVPAQPVAPTPGVTGPDIIPEPPAAVTPAPAPGIVPAPPANGATGPAIIPEPGATPAPGAVPPPTPEVEEKDTPPPADFMRGQQVPRNGYRVLLAQNTGEPNGEEPEREEGATAEGSEDEKPEPITSVTATVTDSRGEGLEGIQVQILRQDRSPVLAPDTSGQQVPVIRATDAEGKVTFTSKISDIRGMYLRVLAPEYRFPLEGDDTVAISSENVEMMLVSYGELFRTTQQAFQKAEAAEQKATAVEGSVSQLSQNMATIVRNELLKLQKPVAILAIIFLLLVGFAIWAAVTAAFRKMNVPAETE